MPPVISPEVVPPAPEQLPAYPPYDLNNCALSSRSWTPYSRSITFRRVILRSAERTIRLMRLLASPHETISEAIKSLHITEGWFKGWRSDGISGGLKPIVDPNAGKVLASLLTDGIRFPHTETLVMTCVKWELTPPSVRDSIVDPSFCQSVVVLELAYWLETLRIGKELEIPFEAVESASRRAPLRLRGLQWKAAAVPSQGTSDNMALALNALLSESADSLESLELHIQELISQQPHMKEVFSIFDLTKNTRLRTLRLDFNFGRVKQPPDFLLPFFENLSLMPSQVFEELELHGIIRHHHRAPWDVLGDEVDEYYEFLVDLNGMSTILQRPSFASLQKVAIGTFDCTFYKSDVTNQMAVGKTVFSRPDDDSTVGIQLNEAIRRLEECFLGWEKQGVVVPLVNARYSPRKPTGWCGNVDYSDDEALSEPPPVVLIPSVSVIPLP
ncbi:hypothetical protein Moror_9834 [Moniliophthora roreri MCA 2997]|uniref:Uncharacterized protein n=1 Tax=Moniliophthora roreri (strain MCA 2997) TaxID=1381753 RepID=V2Y4F2_MONRO|nr:hypothetical protein Moror_9834 [Moniliophthora roreri MCA 2997]